MGKERKPLGIKLKRCVQVVQSTYQTPGMKRIVMFAFPKDFFFCVEMFSRYLCELEVYISASYRESFMDIFFSVSWFLGPQSVCASYLLWQNEDTARQTDGKILLNAVSVSEKDIVATISI